MIANELISAAVVPLKTSDTGKSARNAMDDMKVSHYPIVNNEQFLGLISMADLDDVNLPDEPLGNHNLSLFKPFIYFDQNIFDIVRVFYSLKLTVLPVLDRQNNFLGVILIHDLINGFAKLTSAESPGGIIVLEVNSRDYSMSAIANIVESNDAKILGFYVASFPDSTKLEVTLKLNKLDIQAVLQTLFRFNYIVKASFTEELDNDMLKERFDSLMNYLNI